MKKILGASIAIILILCLFSLSACKRKDDTSGDDLRHDNQNEVDSYLNLDHVTPVETTAETEEETEETEIATEKKVEIIPEKSLKFTSYGNGTCAVSGIGDITDLCVIIPEKSPEGDIVTTIDTLAFYGNKTIKTIQIPSTVTRIGERCFGNCSSLVYISVDPANIAFCDIDGVLYSADLSTLLHFPAASGAASIDIPAELKRISDMAFYNCDSLKTIYYNGSYESWGKIEIGQLNYGLLSASISCFGKGK